MTDDSGHRRLYYDMQALLAGELPPPPQPVIGCRDDGHHIFYAEQVNLVFGDPETGKTWLCLWCAASQLINDPTSRVAVIDMDHNGPTATATRLLAFGVPKEVLSDPNRFRYVEPDDRLHMAQVIEDLTGWSPTVAIVDSLGELMPLYGANSYSGDDFTDVNARVLKPLAKAGAAVVVIDHLSKGADSRNFGPVGTAAKRRAIGGVSLRVTIKDAFTPGSGGAAYLKINKDRHGGLREHCPTGDREPLAGTFTMRVFHDALTGEIKAADGTENVTDDHALSSSQARNVAADIDSLNALDPPPKSVRDVRQRMSWGDSRAQDALKAWRESTGQSAPKNQHEAGGGESESAVPGYSRPYIPGTAGTAPLRVNEMSSELQLQSESAVPQANGTSATVTNLGTRRSSDSQLAKLSCPKWLASYISELQNTGHTTVTSLAVYPDGAAAGHSQASISNAITANPVINEIGRDGLRKIYDITGNATGYTPLPAWVRSYVDTLIRNDIEVIDKESFKNAAEAAGHNEESAARSLRDGGLVRIEPHPGDDARKTVWRITRPDEGVGA